jgi:hypothetical protein
MLVPVRDDRPKSPLPKNIRAAALFKELNAMSLRKR